jgi:predicted glycogen debranching enzyme
MIQFDQSVCRNLDSASRREWLETNGLGGFASSTIAGMNTRRYHGLLVAATRPPVGRMVLLSKLEETLTIDGRSYQLSVNQYPGAIHPRGYVYLKQFRLDPFPVLVYQIESVELEKTIFMVYGEDTTVIQYAFRGQAQSCTLELKPLIAFRDYHSTTHQNDSLHPGFTIEEGNVRVTPYDGLPSLYISHPGGELSDSGEWYHNFEYEREKERGLDYREDLFNPFTLVLDLSRNPEQTLIASTVAHAIESAESLRAFEIRRREAILAATPTDRVFVKSLTRAADQFIVKRGQHATVIAGYHWFSDWGRDTMIALPGLTLSTGRPEIARSILLAFAGCVNQGMVPNRFPDAGQTPEYNTVDATLWFFEAVRAYLAYTGDLEFISASLYDLLADMVAWHERGTRYGIRVDPDGLLRAGESGTQLTWMDAKVGDWVVTPREGKPVEIQALWYNALRVMENLAGRLSRPAEWAHYKDSAEGAKSNFLKLFWNAAGECLYDVVNGEERDVSIRPNQIFAVSLFHSMLSPALAVQVVETVQRHLLTPFGLRTLSPSDPQYRGRFGGDPRSRDSAYHQGTAWPWLMGPFLTAYLKVHGPSATAREQVSKWLSELTRYIGDEGVGQLPEVFDGDTPQAPGGCIAQAWTVAELLRMSIEAF